MYLREFCLCIEHFSNSAEDVDAGLITRLDWIKEHENLNREEYFTCSENAFILKHILDLVSRENFLGVKVFVEEDTTVLLDFLRRLPETLMDDYSKSKRTEKV